MKTLRRRSSLASLSGLILGLWIAPALCSAQVLLSTGSNSGLRMWTPIGNDWWLYPLAAGRLDLLANGTLASPVMSILAGGYIGIGTTSPTNALTVLNGNIQIATNTGTTCGIVFQDGSKQITASPVAGSTTTWSGRNTFANTVVYSSGAPQAGYVLIAADSNGTLKWGPAPGSRTSQTFTANGKWVRPAGVNTAYITVVGGGGGGGSGGGDDWGGCEFGSGGGGGGGGAAIAGSMYFVASDFNVTIGQGGAGGAAPAGGTRGPCGSAGETTTVWSQTTSSITAAGGAGGYGGGGTYGSNCGYETYGGTSGGGTAGGHDATGTDGTYTPIAQGGGTVSGGGGGSSRSSSAYAGFDGGKSFNTGASGGPGGTAGSSGSGGGGGGGAGLATGIPGAGGTGGPGGYGGTHGADGHVGTGYGMGGGGGGGGGCEGGSGSGCPLACTFGGAGGAGTPGYVVIEWVNP